MSGDPQDHMEFFKKTHFHPEKWIFLQISLNSRHQKTRTRNKTSQAPNTTQGKGAIFAYWSICFQYILGFPDP